MKKALNIDTLYLLTPVHVLYRPLELYTILITILNEGTSVQAFCKNEKQTINLIYIFCERY